VLEFLLADHPLDCPICDKAGECRLQNYYQATASSKAASRTQGEEGEARPDRRELILDRAVYPVHTLCALSEKITGTGELGVVARATAPRSASRRDIVTTLFGKPRRPFVRSAPSPTPLSVSSRAPGS